MAFEQARSFLIQKLTGELPSFLTYHNVYHTILVMEVANELALAENISAYNLNILNTAALFHDSGFLKQYHNHEEASCDLAREYLPGFGYSEKETQEICTLIMVTKLPQMPKTQLERILCDADLSYLGSDNYFPIAENLFKEFKALNIVKTAKKWQSVQTQFLQSHRYFTKKAMEDFNATKEKNIIQLKQQQEPEQKNLYILRAVQEYLFILIGVIIAGFALKGFLVPNNFFDGGITGMSLLLHELYHFNLGVLIILLNIPLIIASYFTVSKNFALKTFIAVILLGVCLLSVPYPMITSDKLLISIFGGFFLGLGIGFTMRGGSALDGIEILALYTWKKTSFTITEIILAMNIIIFSIAAIKFGMETALYSILTYFTASKTIDFVIEGIEAYTGVTIISGNSEVIKYRLVNELNRGITVYKGERGFLPGNFDVSSDCDIIFTVVTRLELRKLKNLVYDVDPNAFVFANTIKEASGGIIKRRHVH